MALRLVQIAMNARDDSAVGWFWAEALGWGIDSEEPGVINLATTSATQQADLVKRLQDLGAMPADVGQRDVPWTVLRDPEGNEFDVLTPR